jgi:hypothetical protein
MPDPNVPPDRPVTPNVVPASPPVAPHPGTPSPPTGGPPPVSGEAPSLIEVMEGSLNVLLAPHNTFDAFAQRPAPEFTHLILNTLLWSAIGCLLGLVMVLMNLSVAPGILLTLLIGMLGTLGGVALSFGCAGLLHLLATLSGGHRDFERSYQIISLMSPLLPIAAVSTVIPLPLVWILPTIAAAMLAVRGIERIHGAPEGQTWLIVGSLGAAFAAVQLVFHKDLEATARDLGNRATIYSAHSGQDNDAGARVVLDQVDNPARQYALPQDRPNTAMPGIRRGGDSSGSMNMIRRAGGGPARPNVFAQRGAPASGEELPNAAELQAMSQGVINMLNQQLNANPQAMKNMPREQKAHLQKLMKSANQFNSEMQRSGERGQNLDEAQMMNMLQTIMQDIDPKAAAKARQHMREAQQPPAPSRP